MTKNKEKKSYVYTRKNVVAHKENPWAKELSHTIKKGKKITGFATTRQRIVDESTGVDRGDTAFIGSQKVVDKEEFVKFFGAGIIEVFELAKAGKDLFRVILNAYLDAKNQPDQIYLSYTVVTEDYSYNRSRVTYSNALAELLQKGFLAPVENRENLYWVNPNLFYKGDRIRIVNEYVKSGSPAHAQLMEEQRALEQQQLDFDDEKGEVQ